MATLCPRSHSYIVNTEWDWKCGRERERGGENTRNHSFWIDNGSDPARLFGFCICICMLWSAGWRGGDCSDRQDEIVMRPAKGIAEGCGGGGVHRVDKGVRWARIEIVHRIGMSMA